MAATQDDALSIVNEILKDLKHIATCDGPFSEKKKQSVRLFLANIRRERGAWLKERFPEGVRLPVLVEQTMSTFLGMGIGQELTQRFCLEYLLKTGRSAIAVVALCDPEDINNNHLAALVGPVKIREELEGSAGSYYRSGDFSNKDKRITIESFWSEQENGVIWVDPLAGLSCLKTKAEVPAEIMKAYGSSSILNASSYESLSDVVLYAPQVKMDAENLAAYARRKLIQELLEMAVITSPLKNGDSPVWQYHSKQDCFFLKGGEESLKVLLEKFKQVYGFSAGPTGRVDIVKGIHSGAPMLVFKNIQQIPLLDLGCIITNIENDKEKMAALFLGVLEGTVTRNTWR